MAVGTGAAVKTWHLPKELLANASPFFAAALEGLFVEPTFKRIALPEESPDAFALFVRWLYVGEISGTIFLSRVQISQADVSDTSSSTEIDAAEVTAVQMYLQACSLGDKLGCLVFLVLALLKLIKRHDTEVIEAETIHYVYEHFAQGSKVRLFTVDQFRYDFQDRECWKATPTTPIILAVRSVKDFAPDVLEVILEDNRVNVRRPQAHTGRYMEVLTGTK